ncbi:hypothetical protein EV360DRAFT_65468 [Lentinula raphanica]|nr:hypothetical protein EV360DRAFT_65468 [Lentinula raphanica]
MSKLAVVAVAMTTFLQAVALPTGFTSTTTALPSESTEAVVKNKHSSPELINPYSRRDSGDGHHLMAGFATDTPVTQLDTGSPGSSVSSYLGTQSRNGGSSFDYWHHDYVYGKLTGYSTTSRGDDQQGLGPCFEASYRVVDLDI